MGKQTKHIFVTGGVVSSLGKGISAASIGRLLLNMGYTVRIQKLDPYLNVDPGTMNPFQHGEVFVTDDGAECDLDLGHYERFLAQPCTKHSTYTSGRIYQSVLAKERAGAYNGGTVQVVPHITNEIKDAIRVMATDEVDVVITELGGTVGDIEGLPFMEAVRQFIHEAGRSNAVLCHLAYVPFIKAAGEIKTKPAQHSVQKLREIGLMPDFLLCRSERKLDRSIREKLALFCNVEVGNVVELCDVPHTVYEVPQVMLKQELHLRIVERLGLKARNVEMRDWDLM
ncbi:MAG: CTP synthase, partial [Planctomycetota bacterium]